MQRQPIRPHTSRSPGEPSPGGPGAAPVDVGDIPDTPARRALYVFLQENTGELLDTIRFYALRLGVDPGANPAMVAQEVLQEVAVEALTHADRFTPDRQPMAWLLGIALNMLRRRRVAHARQWRREVPLSRLSPGVDEHAPDAPDASDERMALDRLAAPAQSGGYGAGDEAVWASVPERLVESAEGARELLALVAPDDQRVLRLALLDGLSSEELARHLDVTTGAARMRLSRALGRLRAAWAAQQAAEQATRPDAQTKTGQNGGPSHDQ